MQKLNFQKVQNLKALSGMPQMGTTLTGWEVPLTLVKVIQDIVDGDAVFTEQEINFLSLSRKGSVHGAGTGYTQKQAL